MLRIVLLIAVTGALAYPASQNLWRLGGRFILEDHDSAEVMVAPAARAPVRTVTVMFVGNSLTFVHDMPGMLANLAASDPRNDTELRIRAFTGSGAELQDLRANSAPSHTRRPTMLTWWSCSPTAAGPIRRTASPPRRARYGSGRTRWSRPRLKLSSSRAGATEPGSADFIDPSDPDNAHQRLELD